MIADPALRWVVTVLFTLSAAECIYGIVVGRPRWWPAATCNVLHATMSIAMAVMAWPRGAALPTIPPMVFFLAATVWFVVVVLRFSDSTGARIANSYHAVMMFAMAWMYAAMNGDVLPGNAPAESMHDMHMGPGYPTWVTAVNWLWTVGFAVAALVWLYRYFQARRDDPSLASHFGVLCQAMMALGMSIMFGVML